MNTTTIAHYATVRGYGIAVVQNHRSGDYLVTRTFKGQFITISIHSTEAAARTRANREWLADRG